ncbi:Cyclin [Melia azedarach]|uniref:Cyclin n=1 Tax=Melia azedarach TaxID=155640 RepID=A0ACC1WNV6_MELAZ|nr:Cyclin [Melia azedarach]
MSARNRRHPVSSSSSLPSSTAGKVSCLPENHTKKIAIFKPQLAKKRPALTEITNQRDGSQVGSRVLGNQSKPIGPCSAKIAKKKDSSAPAHGKALSGNILPSSLSVKPSVVAPSKDTFSPRRDEPTVTVKAIPASSSNVGILPALKGAVMEPRFMAISPSTSIDGSVSLDETMSTCDSVESPEFEYIDKEDASAIKSIERRTCSNLNISDHAQREGKICKRDILVDMELVDDFVDIDDNIKDPQFCATTAFDIYKNLHASEVKKRPSMDFMERIQKDINAGMRAILIDWLVEVAEEYMLVPETLFLTVNYIDRYLSGNVMIRQRLQLLGVACMMIAAKYEEICPPQVEEFCYITDNTYPKEEVLKMESAVLNYLKFEMTAPTANCFLRRFIRAAQGSNKAAASMQFECLASYILELSLLEYKMLCYAPSLIAASATFLANFILFPSKKPWNSTLRHYTFYQPSDLCDCVKALHRLFCNGWSLQLVCNQGEVQSA